MPASRLPGASGPCPPAPVPPPTCRALQFGNGIDAAGWGVEASATWIATPYWQLQGGYTYMDLDVDIEPGSTDTTSTSQEGDTPRHQFFLLSRVNLPYDLEFDSSLYWVDELRSQPVTDCGNASDSWPSSVHAYIAPVSSM